MTEQGFQLQVWRPYDRITTAEGVPGKVIGVAFNTKSVRAYISGAPEWIKCELIETHTTAKGADADDAAIIEELHNKVLKLKDENEKLREERRALAEKLSKNYLGELLTATHKILEGLAEKKSKVAKIESGLEMIQSALKKMEE